MKFTTIVAILAVMPVIAFGETCFKPSTEVFGRIPKSICFESVKMTGNEGVMELVSSDGTLPTELKVTALRSQTEDKVKFIAEAILIDEVDGSCGSSFLSKLQIAGVINQGQISVPGLEVSIHAETMNDVCHSKLYIDTFLYNVVK